MSSSEYIPKVGDKVRVVGHPWCGYVGKVILVKDGTIGGTRGARVGNPNFKAHGHHSDWYWFPRSRLEKI